MTELALQNDASFTLHDGIAALVDTSGKTYSTRLVLNTAIDRYEAHLHSPGATSGVILETASSTALELDVVDVQALTPIDFRIDVCKALQRRLRHHIYKQGCRFAVKILDKNICFKGISTHEGRITAHTRIKLHEMQESITTRSMPPPVGFESVWETVSVACSRKSRLAPHGTLLVGPRGCGKSMFLQYATTQLPKGSSVVLDCVELLLRAEGSDDFAIPATPILFLDHLDLLVDEKSSSCKKVLTWLKNLLQRKQGFVLAACCDEELDRLDVKLTQQSSSCGFPTTMTIFPPSFRERKEILGRLNVAEEVIDELSRLTAGFVGKDLARLWKISRIEARDIVEVARSMRANQTMPDVLDDPTAAAETKLPTISGYHEVRKRLDGLISCWLNSLQSNEDSLCKLAAPTGVILHGPSGCGKTLFANSLAKTHNCSFVYAKANELYSQYVGESEKLTRQLFRRAKKSTPCIICFDEIDSIGAKREAEIDDVVGNRVLATLLNEMDGIETREGIFVLGCTNRFDAVDPALLRHGRIGVSLCVDLPSLEDRFAILKQVYDDENRVSEMARLTKGYSCADLKLFCQEIALKEFRSFLSELGDTNS